MMTWAIQTLIHLFQTYFLFWSRFVCFWRKLVLFRRLFIFEEYLKILKISVAFKFSVILLAPSVNFWERSSSTPAKKILELQLKSWIDAELKRERRSDFHQPRTVWGFFLPKICLDRNLSKIRDFEILILQKYGSFFENLKIIFEVIKNLRVFLIKFSSFWML